MNNFIQQFETAREELASLLDSQDVAQAAAQQGDASDAEIGRLQAERTQILGQSFIAGAKPDTAAIDKAIAAAEKRGQEARANAAAARSALAILGPKIAAAKQSAADLERALVREAVAGLDIELAEALNAYELQANRLLDSLAKAEAIARVKDSLSRRIGDISRAQASDLVGGVLRLQLQVVMRNNAQRHWEASSEHLTRWTRVQPFVDELAKRLQVSVLPRHIERASQM